MYFVYMLKCRDASIYTGITNDLDRRFAQHQAGKGARYTSAKGAVKILFTERHPSRSSALKREAEIKRWKREKKLQLIRASRKTLSKKKI